jgi:hypothetical protein
MSHPDTTDHGRLGQSVDHAVDDGQLLLDA